MVGGALIVFRALHLSTYHGLCTEEREETENISTLKMVLCICKCLKITCRYLGDRNRNFKLLKWYLYQVFNWCSDATELFHRRCWYQARALEVFMKQELVSFEQWWEQKSDWAKTWGPKGQLAEAKWARHQLCRLEGGGCWWILSRALPTAFYPHSKLPRPPVLLSQLPYHAGEIQFEIWTNKDYNSKEINLITCTNTLLLTYTRALDCFHAPF